MGQITFTTSIKRTSMGDFFILYLKGQLYENEGERFFKKMEEIVNIGWVKIIVDFAGLGKHINTSGLGKLFAFYTKYVQTGLCRLKISGKKIKVEHLLDTTHTVSLFDSYDTVEQAIQSFIKEENNGD